MALSKLYVKDFIESKDDCYPITLDYRLRSQLRLLHGLQSGNLPYLQPMDIYFAASELHTAIVYVELPSGPVRGGVGWAKMEERIVSRPLPRDEVVDVVWKLVRRQNYHLRKQYVPDISPGLEELFTSTADIGGFGDFVGSVGSQKFYDTITSLIGDEPEKIVGSACPPRTSGNGTSTAWRKRTSQARCSGIHARWSGGISQQTVGGFGGGGIKRPDRSDPFTSTIFKKGIRFHPPIGLVAAATRAKQHPHQTPENLDLVWSAESSEWDTTSGSNLSSDDELESEWSTSEDEVKVEE